MRIENITFSGYKAFPADLGSREAPTQTLDLEPLTLILGKNNIGKSAVARLPRLVLGALAGEGGSLLPLDVRGASFGSRTIDLLYGHDQLTRLRLAIRASLGGEILTVGCVFGQLATGDPLRILRGAIDAPEKRRLSPTDPVLLPDEPPWSAWRKAARQQLDAMVHLGPLRNGVEPSYPVREQVALGHEGAEAPDLLHREPALEEQVGDWFAQHLDGWRLRLERGPSAYTVQVRRSSTLRANLAHAGQGLQQVLPVVAHQLMRQRDDVGPFLDIVEQPELHLHAAAQAPLADLFIDTAIGGRGTTIVETHSEQILLRLQRRIADETIDPTRVAIYFVDDDPMAEGSRLRRIPMDDRGELEWWPAGVFEEDFAEVVEIRRAQRSRGASG